MRKSTTVNYHRGADWHRRHSFPGVCAKCGAQAEKNTMTPLYVRKTSYDNPQILCRLCQGCLGGLLEELNVEMPE